MPWVKLSDDTHDHPEIATVGAPGLGLLMAALCYSNRVLTDGFVPHAIAVRLSAPCDPAELIQQLVTVGLFTDAKQGGISGYRIAQRYVDDQPTREDVERERAQAKARKDAWKARQKNAAGPTQKSNGTAAEREKNGVPTSEERTENSLPVARSPKPDPDPSTKHSRAHALDGFPEFWIVYPKKRAKGDAEKAWTGIRDKTPALVQRIIADVQRQSQSKEWTRDGGQYVPYPATYLRDRRWEDEPADEHPANRRSAGNGEDHGSDVDRNLWERICERVSVDLSRYDYLKWLAPTEQVSDYGDVLCVRVPTDHHERWIPKHYGPLIAAALEAEGEQRELIFEALSGDKSGTETANLVAHSEALADGRY